MRRVTGKAAGAGERSCSKWPRYWHASLHSAKKNRSRRCRYSQQTNLLRHNDASLSAFRRREMSREKKHDRKLTDRSTCSGWSPCRYKPWRWWRCRTEGTSEPVRCLRTLAEDDKWTDCIPRDLYAGRRCRMFHDKLTVIALLRRLYHRRRLLEMTVGERFLFPSLHFLLPSLPSLLPSRPFPPSSVPLPQLSRPSCLSPSPFPCPCPHALNPARRSGERCNLSRKTLLVIFRLKCTQLLSVA